MWRKNQKASLVEFDQNEFNRRCFLMETRGVYPIEGKMMAIQWKKYSASHYGKTRY